MKRRLFTRFNLMVALALGGLVAVVTFLFLLSGATLSVQASPGVLYVAPNGICGGMSPCYGGVQAAVDAAAPGDEIRVAAGTFSDISAREGVTQVVYISKTITIQGGYATTNWTRPVPATQPTTLDAQGRGRVIYVIGDIRPTIENLRITGGNAAGMGGGYWGWDCGGGVYLNHQNANNAATLNNNQVFNNTARIGGGLCLHYGIPSLDGNVVFANTAYMGGGLWLYQTDATLRGNTVFSNTAEGGGGLSLLHVQFVLGHDTLEGNTIISNTSSNMGGGLFFQSGAATLSGNVIRGNTDSGTGNWWNGGGGLYMCCGNTSTLINNVIADNRAISGSGSELVIRESSPSLLHTTFAGNSGDDGSGVYVFSSPDGAYSTVALTNTILVSHTIGISVTGGNTVMVNGILWYNTPFTVSQATTATVTVQNEHWGNPAFAADGYHITAASAAMDAGVDAGVTTDIDGHHRPYGSAPDLGADEIIATSVPTDTGSTLVYTDTQALPTTVQIPASAVTETTLLVYTPVETATTPSGFAFTGRAFELDAYRDSVLLSGFTFSVPVTITLHYTSTDVVAMDVTNLRLEYWNNGTGKWEDAACGSYDRHPTENWLAVPVCHLSRFALFGEQHRIYLPLVLRNG